MRLITGIQTLLLCLAFIHVASSLRIHNKIKSTGFEKIAPFKTKFIEQQVDHFNFRDDRTFKERYLINGLPLLFKLYLFLQFLQSFLFKTTFLIKRVDQYSFMLEMKEISSLFGTTLASYLILLQFFKPWLFFLNMFEFIFL